MTIATFAQTGDKYQISITGHADYSHGGPDIVCSACSMLACTLLQTILSEEAEGTVEDVSMSEVAGDVRLQFTACNRERIRAVTETIIQGFALLQNEYPQHVKLTARTGER